MTGVQVDQVNVLRRADEPAHFLWKGRLYAVRSVRAHWYEQRGAAASPKGSVRTAARSVAGADAVPADRLAGVGAQAVLTRSDDARDGGAGGAADSELWRVEAAAGRAAVPGVFDLCLGWPDGEWTLSTVDQEQS